MNLFIYGSIIRAQTLFCLRALLLQHGFTLIRGWHLPLGCRLIYTGHFFSKVTFEYKLQPWVNTFLFIPMPSNQSVPHPVSH